MTFGQSSGPPATGQQLRELLALLTAAGYADLRDARGPMGFTQRQAAGKFTRDEADEFIERLQSELDGDQQSSGTGASRTTGTPRPSKIAPRPENADPPRTGTPQIALDAVPAEVLAAELQRRGWVVLQPD